MARGVLQIHLARSWRENRVWSTTNFVPLVRPASSVPDKELMGSMLNDKKGPIGKLLREFRADHRELWFIFLQLSQFTFPWLAQQADRQSTALFS